MSTQQNTKSYTEGERSQQLQQAAIVGILGNGFLALIKVTAGLWSGSYSVIADGIDSLSDTATNIISWVTARIMERPADYRYPFGYRRAEAVGTKLLAYLIVFAGLSLGWESIQLLWNQEPLEIRNFALLILVMSTSLVLKLGVAIWQSTISKRISSPLLQANSINMWNDVLISALVLVGLFLSWLRGWHWVDPLLGSLVSVWILYMGIKFIIESSGELMDGVEDKEVYHSISEAVRLVPHAYNPHRIRVRKVGHLLAIDLDIEVEGTKSVEESHEIAVEVENRIKERLPNVYDIMTHVEPLGNSEPDEKFGVSRKDL